MKITRDWLGGTEDIDLDTPEGMRYFAEDVTQDWDAAEELVERMRDGEDEITINDNEPEFIERYTVIERVIG